MSKLLWSVLGVLVAILVVVVFVTLGPKAGVLAGFVASIGALSRMKPAPALADEQFKAALAKSIKEENRLAHMVKADTLPQVERIEADAESLTNGHDRARHLERVRSLFLTDDEDSSGV